VATFVFIDFGVGSAFKLATGDGHIVVESPTNAAGALGVLQLGEFGPAGSLGRNSRMPSTPRNGPRADTRYPVASSVVAGSPIRLRYSRVRDASGLVSADVIPYRTHPAPYLYYSTYSGAKVRILTKKLLL
jgi:hypothetical protein